MNTDTDDDVKPNGYLLLFRDANWDGVPPENYGRVMDRLVAWFEELDREGKIEGTRPLLDGGRIVSGKGGNTIMDGPFPESKEAIGGYVLLKTADIEEAVEVARTNPMVQYGMTVEVRATAATCPKLKKVARTIAAIR